MLSDIVIPLPANESKDATVSVRLSARVQYGGASPEFGSKDLLGDRDEVGDWTEGDRWAEDAGAAEEESIMPLLLESVLGPPSIG